MGSTNEKLLRVFQLIVNVPGIDQPTIASQCELSQSTSYRILQTLQRQHFIEKKHQRYYVHQQLMTQLLVAHEAQVQTQVRWQAMIDSLANQLHYPVYIGRLHEREILVTQVAKPRDTKIELTPPATMTESYHSAMGKCLLAFLPRSEIEQLILKRKTAKTITNREHLANQLEKVRYQGYATDFEEGMLHQRCLAVPIYELGSPKAALAIANLPATFTRVEYQQLAKQLIAIATQMEQEIVR